MALLTMALLTMALLTMALLTMALLPAGLLQGEALSRAYAAADVFVMPSESETLGFVVLESMASQVGWGGTPY